GLSKPSRWRFLVKNSEMEISRCFSAIDSAVARREGFLAGAGEDSAAGFACDWPPLVAGGGKGRGAAGAGGRRAAGIDGVDGLEGAAAAGFAGGASRKLS